MKKILFLHQYFNTYEMNGSTRSLEISKALIKQGYEVEMITATKSNQKEFPSNYLGINIKWINAPYSNELSFYMRILMFYKYVYKASYYSLTKDYDLIYCTSTPLTIGIPALLSSFFRNKKFIFEARDIWPEIPVAMKIVKNKWLIFCLKKLASLCYDKSEFIITLSVDMKSEILKNYNIKTDKIIIAENGSKSMFFVQNDNFKREFIKKHKLPVDSKILLYPGTFGYVNEVSYLAHLANYFKEEISFVIIGSGIEREKIISIARTNLTLNRNFFILDPVPKKDIFDIISISDFIISTLANIPALNQNSANKFFDGLRAGKCVLINHGGWQQDYLENTNSGVRLSRNLDKASKQLMNLIKNSTELEFLKKNAFNSSGRFEISEINNKIIHNINKI
ncbi:glycosyltransferase family 4 protein [Flavobacteriaceae bacterium]|nr:glycosyltransferase family 4 protein [Flavobacteriaceae bacterium]